MLAVLLLLALVSLFAVANPQPVQQKQRGAFVSRDGPVTSTITSDPGAYTIQTDPPYPSSSSTTGDSNSQGVDNVPTVCFYGCYKAFDFFEGDYVGSPGNTCYTQNTTEACTPVCTGANYTALVTCLECIVANGEEDTTAASATFTLDWINSVCEGAGVEDFEPSTTLTATPTTTLTPPSANDAGADAQGTLHLAGDWYGVAERVDGLHVVSRRTDIEH